MSLDTVLKIGRAFRNSPNRHKYFKYILPCPKDDKGNYPLCLTIPVEADFSIDWNRCHITPENQRESLFLLKYVTSDNDSSIKYIYGDIYYGLDYVYDKKNNAIKEKQVGRYRFTASKSAFENGQKDYDSIIKTFDKTSQLQTLRNVMAQNKDRVELLLNMPSAVAYYFNYKSNDSFEDIFEHVEEYAILQNLSNANEREIKQLGLDNVTYSSLSQEQKEIALRMTRCCIFIHFEFNDKKHWYEYDEALATVCQKMLEEFSEQTMNGLYVLKKSIYKTLCSGDDKNDIQFPGFSNDVKYKSRLFSFEDIQDLVYAKDYTERGKQLRGTDIKLIVLPRGNNLTADDYEDFRKRQNDENSVVVSNNQTDTFFGFSENDNENITTFDLVFCKKGGSSSPDKDLIEISGVEKSKLREIQNRINRIEHVVYFMRDEELNINVDLFHFSIERSLLNILGNVCYDEKTGKVKIETNKKYQSHIINVIVQIYSENYFHDEILLPAFIRNVEYSVRNGDTKFIFWKYDLMFLMKIQNNKTDKYMELTKSKSYQLGVKIGRLAKPLGKAISSFEKNYVGLLSRRIATKNDCIRFMNEICEKLTIHDLYTGAITEVCSELSQISLSDYSKDELAFGFFEGYFSYVAKTDKKQFVSRVNKIAEDFVDNEELKSEIDQLKEIIENINNK